MFLFGKNKKIKPYIHDFMHLDMLIRLSYTNMCMYVWVCFCVYEFPLSCPINVEHEEALSNISLFNDLNNYFGVNIFLNRINRETSNFQELKCHLINSKFIKKKLKCNIYWKKRQIVWSSKFLLVLLFLKQTIIPERVQRLLKQSVRHELQNYKVKYKPLK